MTFQAIMNTPGYMPWADEPYVFDTASDAWAFLAQERREAEDAAWDAFPSETEENYSETVDTLDAYASSGHGEDVVYGSTPGYDGSHDLGIAYSVVESEEYADD